MIKETYEPKKEEFVSIRITRNLHKKISLLAVKNNELITGIVERLLNEALRIKKASDKTGLI